MTTEQHYAHQFHLEVIQPLQAYIDQVAELASDDPQCMAYQSTIFHMRQGMEELEKAMKCIKEERD